MKKLAVLCGCLVVSFGLMRPLVAASASMPIVDVSTVAQLQAAFATLTSGTTIRVAPGHYPLTTELVFRNVTNVALIGATGNRADVVIVGTGMATPGVNIAVKVENAQDVRIGDLSIGEAYWHPIQLKGEMGAERVTISNVRLFDAGEQLLKSTSDPQSPNGVDDVIVENSLIEFTAMGPASGYTQGIDIHHGANWIIRHNVIRNIRVPATATYLNRPAILAWSGSRNTMVYGNLIINCERGIIFGQGGQSQYGNSHFGGAIYNNFLYRTEPVNADSGISIWDSPGTRVYHNTVIQNGTYPTAIEYRFTTTTGVEIINNLTDAAIVQREGAAAIVTSNYTQAIPTMFVNPFAGDLHLVATAAAAIDRGIAVPIVTNDWDREARPNGAAPDLGADEWYGAAPPPPPPPPPPPDSTLVAPTLQASLANHAVQLTWTDGSTSETGFVVERADAKRDGFRVIAQVAANATGFLNGGLSRGLYRYRVRAVDAVSGQFSPYSNIVEVRVK